MIEPVRTRTEPRVEDAPEGGPPAPRPALPDGTRDHARTGGKDLFDGFLLLPLAEKVLAGASLGVAFGWIVTAQWGLLFSFGSLGGWFATCAGLGSALVIALLGAKLLDIAWLSRAAWARTLIVASLLPALGLVIELLNNFWFAVTLVGSLAMAWAAGRISIRDHLFRRGR